MSHTFFMNADQVILINLKNGNRVTVHSDDSRFTEFSSLVAAGKYDEAEQMDVKAVVTSFVTPVSKSGDFSIKIENGVGTVSIGSFNYPLKQAIVDKIIQMKSQGFSPEPLFAFLKNLYQNPSKVAIDELFLFLEQSELPITSDGYFIAYKVVREDYLDIHSGTMDNSVGNLLEMPRFDVDDNRNNTCSSGLHFCSKAYLTKFGSGRQETDRCLLLKINPADVVSIPADYNNAKGRTCRYEVVGEVEKQNWRQELSVQDFTVKAVCDDFDVVKDEDLADKKDVSVVLTHLKYEGYRFDDSVNRWRDVAGRMISRKNLAEKFGISVDVLLGWE